ncbi:MAG: TRAP transporter substrate-binding protein [Gammaproteobacteria bacterium]|nr:TRAP transporter substrate-binding protein [Gammaproteobacteria bacterium]MDH3508225.1 TRAP transporter substrate-binding protein [Gammaproteobacteria bacterium]
MNKLAGAPPEPRPPRAATARRSGRAHVFVAVLLLSAATSAQVPMKIGHVVPGVAPRGRGATEVAELVTADLRCDITARVFPASQLGGDTDLIEGLQIGSIEMVILPGAFLVGFQPLIGILDFPFFFPPRLDDLLEVHRSDAMRAVLDTTTEKDIVSLAVWHTGYKIWTSNRRSLHVYENYAGLKVRVMPSMILKEQSRLLGLTAVGMPFAETYSALQNGAIDAQENSIDLNFFMKFHEVQDYAAITNHGILDNVVMVSKDWWDARAPSCQAAIRDAVETGGRLTAQLTNSVIEELALPAFEASGIAMTTPTDEQWNRMRDAVLPGIEQRYIEQNGERGRMLLEALKAEIARHED